MGRPVKTLSCGSVKAAVWQGDYQGKPTYSVTFKKSFKEKSGGWKDTDFFNMKDLKDLLVLVTSMNVNTVKDTTNNGQSAPQQPAQQFSKDVTQQMEQPNIGFADIPANAGGEELPF